MAVIDLVNGYNANDGNPYVPVEIVAGHVDNAVKFNGVITTQSFPYISIPHSADFNQAQISLSCWVRLASKDQNVSFLAKGATEYLLSYDSNLDVLSAKIAGDSVNATTFGSPPLNTWMFVVVTSNPSSGGISFSVNAGTADTGSSSTPAGTNILEIGSSTLPSSGQSIDDLRLFNDILSAGEIAALYNSGSGSAAAIGDEVHWWTLNGVTGGVYPDAVGSLDGTPNDIAISSVAGVLGNAVSILTVDPRNWLSVDDVPALRTNGAESFSLVFWLYALGYPASGGSSILFKTDGGDADYQIDLYSSGTLSFYIAGEDFAYPAVNIDSFPLNQWVMITATFEYGVGLHLQTDLNTPVTTEYLLGCMANAFPEPLIYGRQLNGMIDELYFCKRILTSDEIIYFYNSGAGRALFPAP